ncbi:MAG TPA: ROK family protein [Bryobacteraceae bacterium]|nr:ROK family protein [Bryobacteraceae bacterium]
MLLGIDIGGTGIKAAVVDDTGAIAQTRRSTTPPSLAEFRQSLCGLVHDLINPNTRIDAVGIGCKGIIHPHTCRVEVLPGTVHYLEGQVLSEILAPVLPEKTVIAADNDARVALFGELAWGAARDRRNAIMLTLGTGVGGGILAGGRILRGATGAAGHLGHLTVDPDGPLCICGNRGCLETLFSARTIESEAFAAIHRGVHSRLLECRTKPPSCAEIFELAEQGDSVAAGIIAKATRVLGAAIAGLAFVFDPEIVILGGQISGAGDALLIPLRDEFRSRTHAFLRREIPIVRSALVDPSGVLGAAALALEALRDRQRVKN